MPLILTGFQFVCILSARSGNLSSAVFAIVLWIVPCISLYVFILLYSVALGYRADVQFWSELVVGVVAIVLGNVLPKGAAGMRLGARADRLSVDEKQKIARFWGYCLVCCGIAMCVAALAENAVLFFSAVAATAILPRVYTWREIRKEHGSAAPQ